MLILSLMVIKKQRVWISMKLSISKEEIVGRQQKLFADITSKGMDGVILFSVTDIIYLTGFHFRPSERPIVFFIDPKGDSHLFVPLLEREHAQEYAVVQTVHFYREYPGIKHPMETLKDILVHCGLENKVIGADAAGYSSPKGYEGPHVNDIVQFKEIKLVSGQVEKMRMIKSPAEVELIRVSSKWGNLAHELLHKYSKEGLSEIEISSRATQESTAAMIEALGEGFEPFGDPTSAFYRGQIGEHSYFPHSQPKNLKLKRGDTLVTQAESSVWGYRSELERTMFVQDVSKEQEKYFNLMKRAQEIAFESIIPGNTFSTVEENVVAFYKEYNVEELIRHHIGHNIGLINHEAPFFDLGDKRIMQPGMVATIEPALYVEGLGGFRHSDTVLITENGAEWLTFYPRDLDSLIVK